MIIAGIGAGMISTAVPVLTYLAWRTILSPTFCAIGFDMDIMSAQSMSLGLYGIGIAAGRHALDAGITSPRTRYGPIADNAGGNAEMSGLGPGSAQRTDALDALGNTTAATGKGFAIGLAALTALALLASYRRDTHRTAAQRRATALDLPNGTTQLVEKASLLDFGGVLPRVADESDGADRRVCRRAMMSFLFCGLTMNRAPWGVRPRAW